MHSAEAKHQVPSLVLVNGEDLTPYRQASKRIFSVLARFGVAERLGMDEVTHLPASLVHASPASTFYFAALGCALDMSWWSPACMQRPTGLVNHGARAGHSATATVGPDDNV